MAQMPFSPCDTSAGAACTDRSVSMLHDIFGPVIDALVQGTDPNTVAASANVIATMMSFFNSGILVIGSLIVSYVALMGIANTANDGEAMGKSWSSLWTPVRIVAGGAVLLPTASGYSFIQLVVLLFSLWGVGFANGTFKAGMAIGILSPNGVVQGVNDPGQFYGLRDFAKQYLAASYCAKAANTLYRAPDGTGPQVMSGGTPDKTMTKSGRTEYLFEIKDRNTVTNLAGGAPLCGTVKIATYAAQASNDGTGIEAALEQLRTSTQTAKVTAAAALMVDLDGWVNTWPNRMGDAGWTAVDSTRFNEIVNTAEQSVATALMAQMSTGETGIKTGFNSFANSLTAEGWAMAGGWFQRVGEVRGRISSTLAESVGSVGQPSFSSLPSDAAASELTTSVTTVTSAINKKAEEKANFKPSTNGLNDLTNVMPADAKSDVNIGSIQNNVDSKISLYVNGLMESMVQIVTGAGGTGVTPLCGTAGTMGGSLNRMKCVGDYLTVARAGIGAADVAIKTSATALRVVAGALSSVKGVGTGLDLDKIVTPIWDWVIEVPVKQLAMMAAYIEPLAFYFGVFLPSLPYTIFMVVVVGWVLAVVQSLIAAPLWAVMHMTPDRTFIGSQTQGYLLLLSLFARPALAVVGLFAAILVSDPIIDFVAKGFFSMRGAVVTSTGTVGTIASFLTFAWWFMVFGLTLLPVLYMTFGLPQILPDHVLKWIGAGIGDLGETNAVGQMRGGMAGAAARGSIPDGTSKGGAPGGPRIGGGGGQLLGGAGGGNPPPSTSPRNGGGGQAALLNAGGQGVSPAAPDTAPKTDTRSTGHRVGEAAGVAIGRAVTGGVASAARSAGRIGGAVLSGGREGASSYQEAGSSGASFGQRVKAGLVGGAAVAGAGLVSAGAASASDFSQAGKTAVSEGKAAYSEGADSRIAAFKSELRGESPVNAGSDVSGSSDTMPPESPAASAVLEQDGTPMTRSES
ncbi:DotA/TraY family protein [Janthinobacterium sp. CG_23.4]|uniref:DotA/TraY family protein n=1 Tax=Janthinobacterium sp. CG_23.4 TaxID=2760707 RepID=UPI0024754EEA|nr:DotA/TraY family protein [Janthinobacterium sp. CG_23.4]MDH6160333.1 conjugal transfer/type IV secretion protein DotA/TraY [Janthinobacterium sp. CG_23.4]